MLAFVMVGLVSVMVLLAMVLVSVSFLVVRRALTGVVGASPKEAVSSETAWLLKNPRSCDVKNYQQRCPPSCERLVMSGPTLSSVFVASQPSVRVQRLFFSLPSILHASEYTPSVSFDSMVVL